MSQTKVFIVGIIIAVILTAITSFIRSPWQTYPDGIVEHVKAHCTTLTMPGVVCSDILSVEYGFPFHVKKEVHGFYSTYHPGVYSDWIGIAANLLLYFMIVILLLNVKDIFMPLPKTKKVKSQSAQVSRGSR